MSIAYDPLHDPHKLFHQVTTDVNITQEIQHSGGKATLINGNIFYSPNSATSVGLPPPVENNSKIWRNSKTSSPREFHQPLWWSEETAYLAFFPLYPQFCGEPFGELLDVPNYFDREKHGYILDPQILLKWKKLEYFLRRVSDLLLVQSNAVSPKTIIDTALSCTGYYKAARYFRQAVKQTRDWFSVWMAQVSYTIALAMSCDHSEGSNDIPEWCQFLLRREFQLGGWDQVYIFGVRQSMGNFSPSVLRSGIFLQIVSPPRHQISVDWFQRFHVPVWYPWGQNEVNAAKTSRQVGQLAPPPEKLQAITTFLSKEPNNHADNDTSSRVASQQKPWVAFLADQAVRTKQAIDREMPQGRQNRENRERKPPQRRVKVYVWEKDSDSDNGYRRVLITQKNHDDTLGDFSDTQKVYNAVFNEWDCCEEFSEDKPDSDDGFEDYGDSANVDDTTAYFDHARPIASSPCVPSMLSSSTSSSALHTASSGFSSGLSSPLSLRQEKSVTMPPYAPFSAPSLSTSSNTLNTISGGFSREHTSSSSSSSQHQVSMSSRAEADYDVVYYDAFELLQDFLGFVPPLPLPTRNNSRDHLSEERLKILLGLVGLREQRDDCPSVLIPTDIWDFLDAFNNSKAQFPRTVIWDLAPGNRRYLGTCKRLDFLNILDGEVISGSTPEKLYVFDFEQNATVPWLLAVTSIIDALFVCRLDSRMNDFEIANHLLTRGIRFQTLVWDTLPPPRDLPITLTPFRLSGYTFTLRDYDVYIREREALIRNPRIARAALMKGGIVWHLIVASISASDVLAGPSAAISLYNYGLALGESINGQHLWDDTVSNEELDQICGTYLCYTGFGSQHGPKSWWPTFSTWTINAHNTHWTDFMEKKFQDRLTEIASGKAQPRTASEWRGWVRASSSSRRIMKNVTAASHLFLRNILDDGSGTRRD